MQTICKNEDEGKYSRRTGVVGIVICTGRVSRHMEGECDGRVGGRGSGI